MFFVDDRGFKLNGSVGKAFEEKYDFDEDGDYRTRTLDEGTRVSFVAKVTPSDDDPKFGFFKRPNQVVLLKPKEAKFYDADGNLLTYADKDLVDVTDPNEPCEEAYLKHIGEVV